MKLYGAGQDILKTASSVARREALENAVMLRRMGEFEPARLSEEEMEYTTVREVLAKLGERFKPVSPIT